MYHVGHVLADPRQFRCGIDRYEEATECTRVEIWRASAALA